MNQEAYKHYLRDIIYLMKERVQEIDSDSNEFELGVKCGYEQMLDTIQNQADAFGIDLKEIGFDDFEKFNKNN